MPGRKHTQGPRLPQFAEERSADPRYRSKPPIADGMDREFGADATLPKATEAIATCFLVTGVASATTQVACRSQDRADPYARSRCSRYERVSLGRRVRVRRQGYA